MSVEIFGFGDWLEIVETTWESSQENSWIGKAAWIEEETHGREWSQSRCSSPGCGWTTGGW